MAHFAKINNDNEVLQVLFLDNENILNSNGIEDETIGQKYLEKHNNWPAEMWIQTSHNTSNNKYYNQDGTEGDQSKAFRGTYAGIGFVWCPDNQIFFPPKPYNSWVKHPETISWKSPIGDAPELSGQPLYETENNIKFWYYKWNEEAYQSGSTNVWELTSSS